MKTVVRHAIATHDGLQAGGDGRSHPVMRSLGAVRAHLGMDIAFVSEFVEGRRFIRHLVSRTSSCPVETGDSDRLESTLCQRVVDGRVPMLMQDAASNGEAAKLPIRDAWAIGAHIGVPIRLGSGRIYGTLCCLSQRPDYTLNERDVGVVEIVAGLVADHVERELEARARGSEIGHRIDAVLQAELQMVYQPIFSMADRRVVGLEALARFPSTPQKSPADWFAEAAEIGRGVDIETLAIKNALLPLCRVPDGLYLAVNASPEMILSPQFAAVIAQRPLDRIVIEVTEHASTDRYAEMGHVLRPLQAHGLRVAIDDAGAGYASFRHILNMAPDIIKLDMSITRGIDSDPARQALALAFCGFAAATGAAIVAEGVETARELSMLGALGVRLAQGYFLGRPTSFAEFVSTGARALLPA